MPPKIDHEKCYNCGKCVFQCGKSVFTYKKEKKYVFPSNAKACIDCFICYLVCPYEAVSIVRRRQRIGQGGEKPSGN